MPKNNLDRALLSLIIISVLTSFVFILLSFRSNGVRVDNDLADLTQKKYDYLYIKSSIPKYVIYEYFDMDCPFCNKMTLALMKDGFFARNKDRITYIKRPFPLINIHPNSAKKAIIAHCVWNLSGQENFSKFLDEVVLKYPPEGALSETWVKELAYNIVGAKQREDFETCLAADETKDTITQANIDARSNGISSTPTLVIIKDEEQITLKGAAASLNFLKGI